MCTLPDTKTKVAIADDHPLLRECLLHCLTLWGYSVIIQACNGQDLLTKIDTKNLPEICILDLNMPVLNGYETIKILNNVWPGIKIMVFSMNIIKGVNDILWGADAVISKTDGIMELRSALKQLSNIKHV
jgi:DNA-binding NarL/FixJ family response regulator